jgi:chorismate dehydratase
LESALLFGKIEYLNLLPFHVFMKRYASKLHYSQTAHYFTGVPSKINRDFEMRRVDAAFISSVKAKKYHHAPLGIIAKKEVLSVLLIPSKQRQSDTASATSNILAEVLHVKGEVLIGDRALEYYLSGKEAIDLAALWYERYRLPFVFALLCHHSHKHYMQKMSRAFLKQRVKIPQYLLHHAAKRTDIPPKEILNYLTYISYDLDTHAQQGLKKFLSLTTA